MNLPYIVYKHNAPVCVFPYHQCTTLADALSYAALNGGIVYEPLDLSTAKNAENYQCPQGGWHDWQSYPKDALSYTAKQCIKCRKIREHHS